LKKLFLFIFIVSTFSSSLLAGIRSINPDRMSFDLFMVFGKKKLSTKGVYVKGVQYSSYSKSYIHNGNKFYISEKLFNRANKLGQIVFEATPGDQSMAAGTAFLVGGNFVLTSQHVLSVSRKNTTKCRSFKIQLNKNQKYKTLTCKKIHYCNKHLDFCLIEMNEHRKGYSLSKEKALKLTEYIPYGKETSTMAIGNPQGYGIHASISDGLERYENLFKFYAPVFGGDFGGPIFNDNNEAVGLVRSQSKVLVVNEAYNVGVPMSIIIPILKTSLTDILKQLNF